MLRRQDIYGIYSHEYDFTTIMVETYNENGQKLTSEVVGWYHGKPDDILTAMYYGKLKCDHTAE